MGNKIKYSENSTHILIIILILLLIIIIDFKSYHGFREFVLGGFAYSLGSAKNKNTLVGPVSGSELFNNSKGYSSHTASC